ncbi:Thiol-disulfide oxidoreductase DCC [Quillaja saponaria]|uniref:Thiol-disulfide oxidoreductase DCC n=1 Tax=Quillaja saponaria TaxID=32244 RepID=A0AAD7P856_QUISA|nr:Thiol-disulfide oxidoreductase DCC [Quillaja saponaria]
MAFRAAAAVVSSASATFIGSQGNPSLQSIHNHFRLKFHPFSPNHPQRFISFPIYQPGFRCQIRAISEATAEPIIPKKEYEEQSPKNWKIKMLYDGDCPLCMREVNMLRERNKSYGTIKFVDICSENYSPDENQGLDYKTAMGRIHAILSDGTVVTDVEAFRRLYEQVGLGWVYAITKYKPIAKLADAVYGVWAKYRLQITGRPPIEQILESRKKGEVCNDSNACKM